MLLYMSAFINTQPESCSVFDFAADPLVLPQAAEEADLSGEHLVVGDLVHQLFTWEPHMRNTCLYFCEWTTMHVFST